MSGMQTRPRRQSLHCHWGEAQSDLASGWRVRPAKAWRTDRGRSGETTRSIHRRGSSHREVHVHAVTVILVPSSCKDARLVRDPLEPLPAPMVALHSFRGAPPGNAPAMRRVDLANRGGRRPCGSSLRDDSTGSGPEAAPRDPPQTTRACCPKRCISSASAFSAGIVTWSPRPDRYSVPMWMI